MRSPKKVMLKANLAKIAHFTVGKKETESVGVAFQFGLGKRTSENVAVAAKGTTMLGPNHQYRLRCVVRLWLQLLITFGPTSKNVTTSSNIIQNLY